MRVERWLAPLSPASRDTPFCYSWSYNEPGSIVCQVQKYIRPAMTCAISIYRTLRFHSSFICNSLGLTPEFKGEEIGQQAVEYGSSHRSWGNAPEPSRDLVHVHVAVKLIHRDGNRNRLVICHRRPSRQGISRLRKSPNKLFAWKPTIEAVTAYGSALVASDKGCGGFRGTVTTSQSINSVRRAVRMRELTAS